MRIANNLSALTAYNSLNITNNSLGKSIRKLSTGLRINQASDDAAGFAISEKMRAQISGLDVANRNARDGISFLQTAEGALGETNSMLQRMRELAVQASNDSLTSNDRHYIQLEINELKSQINRISGTTQFNNKRILDGSSGAMWSSNDLNVKARINGGLTYIDEFGQKVSSEGNYKIDVTANPGQAQVQKFSPFLSGFPVEKTAVEKIELTFTQTKITTRTEIVDVEEEIIVPVIGDSEQIEMIEININTGQDSTGAMSGDGWNYNPNTGRLTITGDGRYRIKGTGEATTNHVVIEPGVTADVYLENVNINTDNGMSDINDAAFLMDDAEVNMYLVGTNILQSGYHRAGLEAPQGSTLIINSAAGDGAVEGELNAIGGTHGSGIGGCCDAYFDVPESAGGNVIIRGGTINAKGGDAGAGIGGGGYSGAGTIKIAPGLVGTSVIAHGSSLNGQTAENIGAGVGYTGTYTDYDDTQDIDIPDPPAPLGYETQTVTRQYEVTIDEETEEEVTISEDIEIYKTVIEETTFKDFITHSQANGGSFVLAGCETLRIMQGDGKTAEITLYPEDTMSEVAAKINNAIASTLEQGRYTNNPTKFCTIENIPGSEVPVYTKGYVREDDGTLILDSNGNPIETGEQEIAVFQTVSFMFVRSAIPGKTGELYFSGDEDLLNALGLNTIQEAQESTYTASVYDAHSGASIATNIKSSAPEFKSIIPPEIDVEVDPMAGLSANWDEDTKRYILSGKETYTANLHLKDSGVIFQTGANKGEDFIVQLGDTSCDALGISGVNLLTREAASHAIGILDSAISKIASQRAKIGAYENALEHTMENLSVATLNLTSAESRIRDADMSKEMMKFVKWQILNQSGTSMLAQANQLPNNVLNLIKG